MQYRTSIINLPDTNISSIKLLPILPIDKEDDFPIVLPRMTYRIEQCLIPLPLYNRGKFENQIYYLLKDFSQNETERLNACIIPKPEYEFVKIGQTKKRKKNSK